MEEIPEVKEAIMKSDRILLVFNKSNTSFDFLAAATSLFYTLKKIGKIVNCYPENTINNISGLSSELERLRSFVLTINNETGIISDIYYQKNPKEIKLFLTITDQEIKTKDISFGPIEEKNGFEPNLIISLGLTSLESLEDYYENNFKFFSQKPILNIDNSLQNQDYGKINILEENASFSCLVAKIIKSLGQNIVDKNIATNLFWGIITYHNGKNITNEALHFLTYLKINGAKISGPSSAPIRLSEEEKNILENIISNLNLNKKNRIPIIAFEKFPDKKSILKTINFLRSIDFFLSEFILLWKTGKGVGGIMYTVDELKLQKLRKTTLSAPKNGKIIFTLPENNLQIAQEKILKALL